MKARTRRTSGSVFADLGFTPEEAEHLKVRTDLMIELTKLIRARGLTHARAAKVFGVSQPRISDLTRGKIERFSIDTLVEMLGPLRDIKTAEGQGARGQLRSHAAAAKRLRAKLLK